MSKLVHYPRNIIACSIILLVQNLFAVLFESKKLCLKKLYKLINQLPPNYKKNT